MAIRAGLYLSYHIGIYNPAFKKSVIADMKFNKIDALSLFLGYAILK